MKQQWSCGKTSEHKPKDRLQSTGPKRHLPCFLLLHLFSLIIWIEGNPAYVLVLLTEDLPVVLIYINIIFFQWRLRATATLSSLFPPFRSDQAKQRRNFKSSPWDRDRASASGASLRRSDAEVQVGEFNPPPPLLFYFFLKNFNRVPLVSIFFHCFSSAVAFSNYSRTFFYNN